MKLITCDLMIYKLWTVRSIFIGMLLLLISCGSQKPFFSKKYHGWELNHPLDTALSHMLILVGDAGEPVLDGPDPVLDMLQWHLNFPDTASTAIDTASNPQGSAISGKNTVIFLGDNIYQYGLPPETDKDRKQMEDKLVKQINSAGGHNGRMYFIPGNHDWNRSKPGGLGAVLREQQFVETYLDNNEVFFPGGGCAGPVEVELTKDLVLVLFDSEWWLTKEARSEAPDNGCKTESEFDFLVRLEDILDKNEGRNVVIAMHHPLFSNSNHGGHYSLGDNIFPLRLINQKLLIPLPVIGSVYPLLRKYGVSRQDIPNPKYQQLKNGILSILEDRTNVVVASGHDHNLQLKINEQIPFIVSGSGSKVTFVARGRKADFTHQSKGFAKLMYYKSGETWVEYWEPLKDHPRGKMTFRTLLDTLGKSEEGPVDLESRANYQDSTKLLAAGPEYEASGFKTLVLGKHYRDVWVTPVKVKYLDMDTEAGGLVPLQKGGGMQTISLRLQGKDDVQYNLRSINKNPKGIIPNMFHGTFAESLVKDQISSAHPYGAFVIPPLAQAANVYHTNPKLFYIPDDISLGQYRREFSDMLALFEVRPDEDLSQYRRFGFSENVVSTNTMRQKIREDNDNEVDGQRFLRSRLFDMIIGDWDRHEDQWRWAEFEKEDKGSIYSPIPRDRDQVFTKFDGIIPWLASRRWAQRNLSHFDYHFNDIVGLNMSAKVLDRRLLNNLEWTDWKEAAESIMEQLTDEVIDNAVKQMPENAYKISGAEIANKLKSRKSDLIRAVRKYYLALSREVDITGSEKHEYFRVDREASGQTKVTVYKAKKDGEVVHEMYQRTFDPTETKEIRIYTLGGKDSVLVTGTVSRAIKLRIVGGNDENSIVDRSAGGPVIVYDNLLEDNLLIKGPDTRIKTSEKEYINEFDPEEYQYNYVGPRLSIELNADDGIYLGGGVYWNNYGFRRQPYKSEHLLLANAATATSAFNFKYQGTYYSALGRDWDLAMNGMAYGPKFVFNYFGQGNGTIKEFGDIDYYRIRMNYLEFNPSVNYRFSKVVKFGWGPTLEYIQIKARPDNITTSEDFDSPEDLASDHFIGTKLFMDLRLVDYLPYPRRGLIWHNEWSYKNEWGGSDNFHRLLSDLSIYVTPNLKIPITLAMRFGVAANLGSYKFYQSNFLGGTENLRGFRKTRFAGKTAAYQNTEIRIALSELNNYFFTGYMGILGFIDHGRVWTEDMGVKSSNWKRGYGPGVWINFFKLATVTFEYGISKEEELFSVNFGLQF